VRAVAFILVVLGALGAHTLQVRLDPARHQRVDELELMVMPAGEAVRAVSLGYETLAADLLWVRAVLVYGGLDGEEAAQARVAWLGRMIRAVVEVDPIWRTPYFYGATLLRTSGGLDDSDEILHLAMEALPDDPYFPFALGMNHYIARDDALEAARWLKRAAELPGAPAWYGMAARGLVTKKSGLETSIRYLEEEIASAGDEDLREKLQTRLDQLRHDRWVEELEGVRADVEAQLGRPLTTIDELVELGVTPALPPDPLGGSWILNADGDVISTVAEVELVKRALRWERSVLTRVFR